MSFSKDTKQELCNIQIENDEQKRALAYGLVLFSRVFYHSEITVATESRPVALLYSGLVSALTNTIVELTSNLTRRGGEKSIFTISIPNSNDCERIFDYFGHSKTQPNLRINRANIETDECLPFFLRGAFLVCGNVTNPEKDYHLEFVVPHKNLAADLAKIISEINEVQIEANTVLRKGSYVVYIKGSDNIADMLAYMGASMASLGMIQSKMLKSVRNRVNRKINSETANLNKTATASAKQLNAIEMIQKKRGLDSLPDDLKEIALVRMEYPEYNLRELGQALSTPISRSGANHRIQRILDIASELSGK